jgi:hypothetical protein
MARGAQSLGLRLEHVLELTLVWIVAGGAVFGTRVHGSSGITLILEFDMTVQTERAASLLQEVLGVRTMHVMAGAALVERNRRMYRPGGIRGDVGMAFATDFSLILLEQLADCG